MDSGEMGGIGRGGPRNGDCVVRRRVLDEKASKWKLVPLKRWPGGGQEGLRVTETVPEAVEDALEGSCKRVYVGSGRHSWEESRLIVGGWRAEEGCPAKGAYPGGLETAHILALTGDTNTRMWGMWILEPHAQGSFEGVTLALSTSYEPEQSTLEVWHGPWVFHECELRSTGGIVLHGVKKGDISCVGCSIGGLDAGEKDEYGDWVGTDDYASGTEMRATFGVAILDLATADLASCIVEYTGLVHAACRALASARMRLDSCVVHSNSVGLYMDDSSTVEVLLNTTVGPFLFLS